MIMQEIYPEAEPDHAPQPAAAAEKATSQPAKNPKSSPKEIESGIQNIQKEITQKNEEVKKEYHYPPLKLLKRGDGKSQGDSDEHLRKRRRNYRIRCIISVSMSQ